MTARIFALFFGLFTLVNLAGNLLWPGFDASAWWIGFGPLPAWLVQPLLAVFALTMLTFALRPPPTGRRPFFTIGIATVYAAVALANAVAFYRLMAAGRIAPGFPTPFSLLVFVGMVVVASSAWTGRKVVERHDLRRVAAGGLVLLAALPLALMLFFGNTDYRRPADAVVVFGARVYASGKLSDALADRMRTACEIYRAGLAKRFVFSGGPGDGTVTEAAAMRLYALAHGVPARDIVVDDEGANTEATVQNTMPIFRQWGARRVLAVSHFYHLPRIKLAYQRAGMDVYTVPARQERILARIPFYIAREAAAFWSYYFKEKPANLTAIRNSPPNHSANDLKLSAG